MEKEAVLIENKEIRGIAPKHIGWLVGALSTILISILVTYFGIRAQLNDNHRDIIQLAREQQAANEKTKELQIEIAEIRKDQQDLQLQILTLQVQLKEKGIIPIN